MENRQFMFFKYKLIENFLIEAQASAQKKKLYLPIEPKVNNCTLSEAYGSWFDKFTSHISLMETGSNLIVIVPIKIYRNINFVRENLSNYNCEWSKDMNEGIMLIGDVIDDNQTMTFVLSPRLKNTVLIWDLNMNYPTTEIIFNGGRLKDEE